jgi:hypothetical protein
MRVVVVRALLREAQISLAVRAVAVVHLNKAVLALETAGKAQSVAGTAGMDCNPRSQVLLLTMLAEAEAVFRGCRVMVLRAAAVLAVVVMGATGKAETLGLLER